MDKTINFSIIKRVKENCNDAWSINWPLPSVAIFHIPVSALTEGKQKSINIGWIMSVCLSQLLVVLLASEERQLMKIHVLKFSLSKKAP